MAEYLPPIHIAEVFNISDYDYQQASLNLKDSDDRYLHPIKRLQEKTFGITYNGTTETTNVSKNINTSHLMNTVNGAIRNDVAIGESLAIGSNLVVGKNIVNSGDIHTNNIYAKSINLKNGVFKNILIDDIPISSQSISFISTLTSDVQLQLDTNSKKIGPAGKDGLDSTVAGPAGKDGLDSTVAGPAGRDGADSTVAGPAGRDGADSTVAGPAGRDGADSTVAGPAGRDGADSTVAGPAGRDGADSTVAGPAGKDGINSTLGAYFINIGVGTFPIYGSMRDFSLFGLDLYIKGDRDSFIIMPYYALFIFSEINQGGRFLSMGNLSNNIEYFNISPLFRVKSCTLYKWNQDTQAYELVNTVNNTNPEQSWN
jgi:hypothetical protein